MFDHLKKKEEISEKACHQKKGELIRKLLDCVNYFCDKEHLTYVALDSLLSFVLGEELLSELPLELRIGMPASDYKKLVNAFWSQKTFPDISLEYKGYITLQREFVSMKTKGRYETEYGKGEVQVSLQIEPLSFLPDSYEERVQYLKTIAAQYGQIRGKYLKKEHFAKKLLKGKSGLLVTDKNEISCLWKMIPAITSYNDTSYVGRIEQKITNVYKTEDIFPAKKVEIFGGMMMIPANPDHLKKMSGQEMFEYFAPEWKKTLEALDQICEKHDITYFAIRDLLKVVMTDGQVCEDKVESPAVGFMREDFDRLIQILKNGSEELILIDYDEKYPHMLSLTTKAIIKTANPFCQNGVTSSVELVSYDRLSPDYEEGFQHKERIRKIISNCNRSAKIDKNLVYFRGQYDSVESQILKTTKEAVFFNGLEEKANSRVFHSITERGKNIPVNELLPVGKHAFMDMELSVPYNPYLWAVKKEEGFTRYLTEGKCEVLKRIDQLCHEQNIPYFATAKLLIGAKVYHDVIPGGGEDSFSIGLIRKDYERLLQLLRENGDQYGLCLNESRDGEGKVPLITKHITLTDRGYGPMMVRLHPYDKVPASFYTRNDFLEKIKAYNAEYEELIHFKYNTLGKFREIYSEEEIKEKKSYYKNMDILATAAKIDEFAQKYNDDPDPQGYQRLAFDFSGKVVSEENISQVERVTFADIEIDCLKDMTPWYQPMDKELRDQIDSIQKANIVLMKEFDRVCQELGIGYFICAGTLLGYIRHQGFIPWDDDVDVGMLREDYDKLLELGPAHFGEDFFLQTRESDPKIPYVYSKLRMNHTEYFTDFTYDRDMHKGIGLDIFPFDYVPNDMKKRASMVEEATKRSKYHNLVVRNQYPEKEVPFPPRNEEEAKIEKEQKDMIRSYWDISLNDTQNAYLEEATKCNEIGKKEKYNTVASFVIGYTYIDVEDLLPYQRDYFEGIEVSIPKNPIPLMSMQYGDYMQMPLTHQQVSHKVVKWSIDEEIRQKYHL